MMINKKDLAINEDLINKNTNGVGSGLVKVTRIADIREKVMSNPKLLDDIGSAWRLFVHLMFVSQGSLIGTHDEIAQLLSTNPKSLSNWTNTLVKHGIAKSQRKGKGIEITLGKEHMAIAEALVTEPKQSEPIQEEQDPELKKLIVLYKAAKETKTRFHIQSDLDITWKQ